MLTRPVLRSLLVLGLTATLTSCQALTDLVGGEPEPAVDETSVEAPVDDATDTATTEEAPEETPEPATNQGPVPSCDAIYSDALVVAFGEEGRIAEGDISQDGYGYGTTNQDLIAVLEGVRTDLRVSCTWYLPPEFSSTTSMAILSAEAMTDVEATLIAEADSQVALGSGQLWKIDSSSSNISGEFTANEAHFITATPCPASLAETECALWVSSTNSAGSSEELTRDAATVFGALN